MRYILIWLLAVSIAACTPSKLEKTALTPSERALVRGAVDDVARGDSTSLSNKVPPELAAKLAPVLGKMREQLPVSPLELSFLNANWTLSGGGRSTDAVYSVKGKSGWALVEANTQTSNGRTMLTAIYIQRTPADPEKVNSFSLREARPAGWAMLVAMAAALAITIAGIFRVWRSGQFRRRWLWTIGAVIGVTVLRMNWTTGEFSFQPIYFQLFSVGAAKQPIFAPWILAVSVPMVALIALFRRGKSVASGAEPMPDAGQLSDEG